MSELNIDYVLEMDAKSPTKSYFEDGGWDLYALEDTFLPCASLDKDNAFDIITENEHVAYPKARFSDLRQIVRALDFSPAPIVKVRTGLSCKIPRGMVGILFDRSGLSTRNGITRVAGVIDSTYTGEIQVGLVNLGRADYTIEAGQKIIQMVLLNTPLHVSWNRVNYLEETGRNQNGFGSTG